MSTRADGGHRQRSRPAPFQQRGVDSAMVSQIRAAVLADSSPVTDARLAAAVHSSGRLLGSEGTLLAVDTIRAELRGLGPLQELASSPGVTDILVNGPDQVWVDSGLGLELTDTRFADDSSVRSLAARLIAAGGRRLDDSNPCVDVRLEGYRVHAVLSPVSTAGTLLSIRIRRSTVFTLEELFPDGPNTALLVRVLTQVIHRRLNFLISGATGTGKTTLLSTMLGLCPETERLVLVEDAAELNPEHPHVVGLQSRHSNLEGSGAVELADLVKEALRMRPDRLIVGECRGTEVRELLSAMNTGHAGAGGTVHANSAQSVPARLSALGALAGMNREALSLQAANAIDVVIHLVRTPGGRTVGGISMLSLSAGELTAVSALELVDGSLVEGSAWPDLNKRLTG
ncbi:TadA family conjugal transfer-associated ATPase [Arthrobacter roseus]|uniref:TadA family conjugal transfer-associated ATPase n=1 Tax=Arthrobacter roseus TaxID=136274 RepID=UPI003B82E1F6|nr:pilus assembly protein CpaF [Arthrobacter roseus]